MPSADTASASDLWLSGSARKDGARDLLSGMISGFFCKIIEYPFDTIKVLEQRGLPLSSLVDLSRGQFLAAHVVATEEEMLRTLGWRVHPPTAQAFARDFHEILLLGREDDASSPDDRRDDDVVAELSRFLAELSACDYSLALHRPSTVALARSTRKAARSARFILQGGRK